MRPAEVERQLKTATINYLDASIRKSDFKSGNQSIALGLRRRLLPLERREHRLE